MMEQPDLSHSPCDAQSLHQWSSSKQSSDTTRGHRQQMDKRRRGQNSLSFVRSESRRVTASVAASMPGIIRGQEEP